MEDFDFERRYPQGLLCGIDEVPEGFGAIYLITNLINGKVYVGQTWRSVRERWRWGHLNDARHRPTTHLHYAINLYGSKNFTVNLLGWANDQERLSDLERLWIACLNSSSPDFGYNLTLGGEGLRTSEETKKKLSESHKLYYTTPGALEKKSEVVRRMWEDPSIRATMSEAQRKRYESQEERNRMGELIRQAQAKPEVRKKMSEKSKQRWNTFGERERGSVRAKIALSSPEVRKRISEGTKNGKAAAKLKRQQKQTKET